MLTSLSCPDTLWNILNFFFPMRKVKLFKADCALFELCIIGLSFENFELIPREWGIVGINHSKYFQ